MNILKAIAEVYWHFIASPKRQAIHRGAKIGKNTFIDSRLFSTESYLIIIGDNVQITKDVRFHTHGGAHVARRQLPKFDTFGKIVIEDWAYIGAGSQIMPGVTVGEGSLIAAGSIVTKSVPPGEVWGGNPAKFICKVDDYIDRNQKYNTNTKGMSHDEKMKVLLSLPDSAFLKK